MKLIKYFIQFLIISILFFLFKVLGLKLSSRFSKNLFSLLGPFFRSKKIINENILKAFPNLKKNEINKISKTMWENYGRILSEYIFLNEFRLKDKVEIKGQEILDRIKKDNERVIFVSGHFNNFELMAMHIEKSGIDLAAIYRPLNNKFLNYFMEKIRKKHICKNQIKKGYTGTRQLLSLFKKGCSIALMIDQRVSEGIKSRLFNHDAFTTTIPAQFVKKFECKVVPIYIERVDDIKFRLTVNAPINFSKNEKIDTITLKLNSLLEKMILKNPGQWIWSHNRWK
ncbi:lipid A biosynthesis acyltransferase [Candidatus Pelagibacter sp.]|nr:lipid A biosynthesis acyltransferase [Candidatus Pelagibacter sp.]MDC6468815.1 lipid A biosynthesis acyltransferase [Candidatus Pelagibacter sp.]|tara:strand:+ start:390 stop:1241 length:852 start_codon:yes stop_codon:yes gene_type:complete